jgi:peptidyl-prolyl cis-trans isomerase SurA
MLKHLSKFISMLATLAIVWNTTGYSQTRDLGGTGKLLDGIAAIVNDGVVLRSELNEQLEAVIANLENQQGQLPPRNVIESQVLERLIIQRIQLQRAERLGIRIPDEVLNSAITNVAQKNNVSFAEFPQVLAEEGIGYEAYRQELREQLTIDQLRQRDVASRILVSPSELESFLILQKDRDALNYDYDLSHILITVSSSASVKQIENAENLVSDIYQRVANGENFATLAVEFSQGQQTLNGGRLGWLKGEQLPTIFIQAASQLEKGEVSQPFRSSSGFHLILLNDFKGIEPILQDQIRVRHILIKTNEILDDDAAKEKLKTIREQIVNDGDFGAIASAVSEDVGSAQDGGDMGWTGSGFFVPEFEEVANAMENDEISEPFKSRYGWHIVQFLGKRVFDNTNEIQRRQAISAIRNSKLSDEIELWVRQLRDEAFVELLFNYD